ncbi:MAG: hypothetical protein HOP10_08570 [Chitinophagaceae bacterium]|nr:hypothetical protein [Chitinophagaceae bacterium]
MRYFLLLSCIFLHCLAKTQTPYLSVKLKMDSVKAESSRYKIEMKVCEPKKLTERNNWFSNDTSKIDFASLLPGDITCQYYIESDKTRDSSTFNQFKHGRHLFAWEKIIVFKISNASSRGWWPEMFIVVPVRYKAFVTYVDLSDVEFQSGKLMFVSDFKLKKEGMSLFIEQSLKDQKTTDVKDSPLKDLLEEK